MQAISSTIYDLFPLNPTFRNILVKVHKKHTFEGYLFLFYQDCIDKVLDWFY
jgi:hypothetical protein